MLRKNEITLSQVLEVENDLQLLDFVNDKTGCLYWPLIRTQFLRSIISDLVYDQPLYDNFARNYAFSQVTSVAARALMNNALNSDKRKILLSTSQVADYRNGSVWSNRLSDGFVSVFPKDSSVLEFPFGFSWHVPKTVDSFRSYLPAHLLIATFERVLDGKKFKSIATDIITLVKIRAAEILQWNISEEREHALINVLSRRIAGLEFKHQILVNALRDTNCQLALIEMGSYGAMAPIILAARSLGIVTAEYQHGAVSAGHDAYCISEVLAGSKIYRRMLPDYFLGYGDWWTDQINLPLNKISIGNPHRSERRLERNGLHRNRNWILILGDGIEAE